jgi:hypothetical protein
MLDIDFYIDFLGVAISEVSKEVLSEPKPVKMLLLALLICERRRALKAKYENSDMTANEYSKCIEDTYREVEQEYR